MSRRRFLYGAGAAVLAAGGLAGWRWWPEQGFWNPCLARLPPRLAAAAAPVLREIRAHNPLLFDFALKRHLRSGGRALDARVFHTRPFFALELRA